MRFKNILMVDDDPDDRLLFIETIQEIDPSIKCVTAEDGVDAIKYLKETDQNPDIIFLDLNMPLMDGKQCLKEIKKIDSLSAVPIIIYTTSNQAHEIEATRKMGANHFLTKPVSVNDIKEALQFVLSQNWK